jgi:hypothetical protein
MGIFVRSGRFQWHASGSYAVCLPFGLALDGIRPVTAGVESGGLLDTICLSAVNSSIALNQFCSSIPGTEPSRKKISCARAAISSSVNGSIAGVGLIDGEATIVIPFFGRFALAI